MSIWSGTPSRFTPSSSAVSPHRSSDSVKTSFARLNVPSSWAICPTVSTMTRLISSASATGTVEKAAVRLTSSIGPHLQDVRMRIPCVRANGKADRRPQVAESRSEPLLPDPEPDGLREVQRRVGLLSRNDRVPEPSEPLERLVADARVHEQLIPVGVQARSLERRLERAARVHEGRDHLWDRRDDPTTAGPAERAARPAPQE